MSEEADGVSGVGRRIGRHQELVLERILDHGAHGAVWLARDEGRKRRVAVKLLQPGSADDATTRARFVREGKRFGAIRHPNLVRVHGLGEYQGQLYLGLEYVEGRNLFQMLREGGPFGPQLRLDTTRRAHYHRGL